MAGTAMTKTGGSVRVALGDLIKSDVGPTLRRGRQSFWPCPFHEDRHPSLTLMPDGQRWKCFGCGRSGDAIDWVRARRGLSFSEAVTVLEGGHPTTIPVPSSTRHHLRQIPRGEADPGWTSRAAGVVDACTRWLDGPEGTAARDWLAARRLTTATLSRWQIGFNPQDQELEGFWVLRGITIPWTTGDEVYAINVRRAAGEPKYQMVSGSRRTGLYLGDVVRPGIPTLLAEGEFDALLGWQEAGSIVNVATLGSASTRPDCLAIAQLINAPVILLAYDKDEAGAEASKYWKRLTARARTAVLPRGRDLTEFVIEGGDICLWIAEQLERAE